MKPCSNCVFARRVGKQVVHCGHPANQVIMLGGKRVSAHVSAANPHNNCALHEKEWLRGTFHSLLGLATLVGLSLSLQAMHPGLGAWAWPLGLALVFVVAFLTGFVNAAMLYWKSQDL